MPFLNRIRLPIKISRPQFPEEREVFRKANGVSKTISVVVRKTYEMETALMPARIHERLKIALVHDVVNIENDKYLGGVTQAGDYSIQWPEFQDFPVSKATATLEVTPFNASNNNCATCEEMNQVVANDDYVPDPLSEGEEIEVDVLANDEVCCSPVTLTIITTNAAYVLSAEVTPDNKISITLKTPLSTNSSVAILTYRVDCGNGSYDEADVIAEIEGSVEGCTAPQNVRDAMPPEQNTHMIEWDDSSPADGYEWQLYEEGNLGLAIQTGTTAIANVNLSMLNPCTDYRFFVRAKCSDDLFSEYTQMTFSTLCETPACGRYEVTYDNGTADTSYFTDIFYMDCGSTSRRQRLFNQGTVYVCALENGPGNPVEMTSRDPGVNYTYVGEC